jgi:hypothetical protein
MSEPRENLRGAYGFPSIRLKRTRDAVCTGVEAAKFMTKLLPFLVAFIAAHPTFSGVAISYQNWNGEDGSAYGYVYRVSPANNSVITIDLDEAIYADWVLPKTAGYVSIPPWLPPDMPNPFGEPFLTRESVQLMEWPVVTGTFGGPNYLRSKWVAYFNFSDGVDAMGNPIAHSPNHTGHFGVLAWASGDPAEKLEFSLQAEVDDSSKCLVSWISYEYLYENDWEITAILKSVDGLEREQAATIIENPGGLRVITLYVDVEGAAPGDVLVLRIKGAALQWAGSALVDGSGQTSELPFSWRWYSAPAHGWMSGLQSGWTESLFMGPLYLGAYPWIYQVTHGWLFKYSKDSVASWYYSEELGFAFADPAFGGWFIHTTDGSHYEWKVF